MWAKMKKKNEFTHRPCIQQPHSSGYCSSTVSVDSAEISFSIWTQTVSIKRQERRVQKKVSFLGPACYVKTPNFTLGQDRDTNV